jgi:hypothetical protein
MDEPVGAVEDVDDRHEQCGDESRDGQLGPEPKAADPMKPGVANTPRLLSIEQLFDDFLLDAICNR